MGSRKTDRTAEFWEEPASRWSDKSPVRMSTAPPLRVDFCLVGVHEYCSTSIASGLLVGVHEYCSTLHHGEFSPTFAPLCITVNFHLLSLHFASPTFAPLCITVNFHLLLLHFASR